MRFIATADWQLGMAANFLEPEARARYHQARFDAVVRIAELARERSAEFVVVCGDVFESNQLDRKVVARGVEAMASFSVPLVLLPGNHDPLDAASVYDSPAFWTRVGEHVRVLRDDKAVEIVPGVEIVGAPWFSKRPLEDLVARACSELKAVPERSVRIVAGHGAVSTINPDRDSVAAIATDGLTKVLQDGCANVVVLGDRHGTLEVGEGIWYPGTPEVTHRREVNPGNVLVIDVDPDTGEVAVEPVHVGQWRFEEVRRELIDVESVEQLASDLAAMPDKARTALWFSLSGGLSAAAMARLEEVLAEAAEVFARVGLWERHTDLVVVPEDGDFSELGLAGFAQEALADLLEMAASEADPEAQSAADALTLLYRYAGGVR